MEASAQEAAPTPLVRVPDGGLDALVDVLLRTGFVVVAPVARDGVISLHEIASADELAKGWTDVQEPGRYRAENVGGPRRFAHAAPARPWKRWLHPERTLLVRTRTGAGSHHSDAAQSDAAPLAFVGIQACDLAAIEKLDVVLAADDDYQRRRAGLFTVAVACTAPASTCFCASAGTGPMPGPSADLVMVELDDGIMVATAHSAAGAGVLEEIGARGMAPVEEVARARELVALAAASQTRGLDPSAIAAAAASPEHDGWDEVAERCLSCGNCTLQCPTCFCTSTEDATLLDGETVERWQRWDSCFSLDFSHVHGGPVRAGLSSRYRQWYLHKLVTWHDQFGSSGCVGCGRCITWCPTGIDITKAVVG